MFQGFPEETIRFFLDLRYHNEVPWFHAHHDEYEKYVRAPFAEFIEAMGPSVLSVSDDMELRPNKCLARINRDIRYTRDKSPYRDHLWLLFRRSGEPREESVMYWFELSPECAGWGLGFWGPNRPAMDRLREKMVLYPQKVEQAFLDSRLPDPELTIGGERFARMKLPPSLSMSLTGLYPMKEIYIARNAVPLSLCYKPELINAVAADYLRLKPLYLLLRETADEAKQ